MLTDDVEYELINGKNTTGVNPGLQQVLPDYGTPLIIQDKTFLDNSTIAAEDPTWNWGNNTTCDLWYPHVYMPIQNQTPPDNAFGRWDYAPWFDPLNFTPTLKYPPSQKPIL
jgi:hypothetical protein